MRFLVLFLILFAEKLNAQINSGARSMAMANAATALNDVYSLGSNQAGIASLKRSELAFAFQEHNYSTNVRSIAAFLVFPSNIGVFGLYANNYSLSQNFNELRTGLTLSRLLTSKLAISGTLNYNQLSISDYGINRTLSFDLGFQYRLSEDWVLGVHLNNPAAYVTVKKSSYNVPAQIRLGTSYVLSDQILLAIDSEYDLDDYFDFRFGLEYSIINRVNLRGGTSLLPFKQYMGAGIDFNKISVDAASSFHPQLGISSQLSLNYAF
ncbi:PorV/PorQ family protein [Albibacterium bauzanense]|uniref:Outer membrane protein with beta-barrel domain n=1 Tax=Albibacterium bauzanense TaxID=653929 RepID=A0A4R1M0S4_9SPHI|nr:hypothetical protein [Albibacterium bauzanense]TCK84812.1 hypothetical protein C8N28_0106 [Albibacterium bauzanense]